MTSVRLNKLIVSFLINKENCKCSPLKQGYQNAWPSSDENTPTTTSAS